MAMQPPAVARAAFFFFLLTLVGAAYDEQAAVKHASISVAAYCGYPHMADNSALESWSCGPPCEAVPGMTDVRAVATNNADDSHAFVGKLNDTCVVAFRGTTKLTGWVTDIAAGYKEDLNASGVECQFAGKPCYVGYGWLRNYRDIRSKLLGDLSDIGCSGWPITVTGHSLGAAMSMLAMLDFKQHGYQVLPTYTFGQPRVGDETFSNAFREAFGPDSVMRVTHSDDPVPHVPPQWLGFQHIATEVFYAGAVHEGYRVCDGTGEDPSCSDQFWLAPALARCLKNQLFSNDCDHLTYMTGALPFRMDGESCTMPQPAAGPGKRSGSASSTAYV